MTNIKKQELLAAISILLDSLDNEEHTTTNVVETKSEVEMFTIKECCSTIKGLNEFTVRQLVSQNVIPHVRAGKGRNGKILIPKSALVNYLNGNAG